MGNKSLSGLGRVWLLLVAITLSCGAQAAGESTGGAALKRLLDFRTSTPVGTAAFDAELLKELKRVGNRDEIVRWVMNRGDATEIGVSFRYTHQHLILSVIESQERRAFVSKVQIAFDAGLAVKEVNTNTRELEVAPPPPAVEDFVQKVVPD